MITESGQPGPGIVIEIIIGPGRAPGWYRAEVARSPAGTASAEFSLDAGRLLSARSDLQRVILESAQRTRGIPSREEETVRGLGRELFAALFGTPAVAACYAVSVTKAAEHEQPGGLRIVLRISPPELAALPWEAMYDPGGGGYYVCRRHQLVRQVTLASFPSPPPVRPPLRVLGVISTPRSLPSLDTGPEHDHLARALSGLSAEVTWAQSPTWPELHERLMSGPWHVIHFAGHGTFDQAADAGLLALTRDDGQHHLVTADELPDLIGQAQPRPRLVVLNTCSSAEAGTESLLAGTAPALVNSGIPAVVAMQYEISDRAAIEFTRGFYAALARGRDVDEAVSAGRVAIIGAGHQTLEWITPVVYVGGHGARLFTLPAGDPRPTPVTVPVPAGRKRARLLRRSWLPVLGLATVLAAAGALFAVSPDGKPGHAGPSVPVGITSKPAIPADEPSVTVGWAPWTGAKPDSVSLADPRYSITQVAFGPGAATLAVGSVNERYGFIPSGGATYIWDVSTRTITDTFVDKGGGGVGAVAFGPGGNTVAAGDNNGSIYLWTISTKTAVRLPDPDGMGVTAVVFGPGGTLAAGDASGITYVWNTAARKIIATLPVSGKGPQVNAVAFGPDDTLAAGENNGVTRVWDIAAQKAVVTLPDTGSSPQVNAVAFGPDDTLAVGDSNGITRLWDVAAGNTTGTLPNHGGAEVESLEFGPGGTLAEGDDNGDMFRWDLTTQKSGPPVTLPGGATISALLLGPGGTILAAGYSDETAIAWRT